MEREIEVETGLIPVPDPFKELNTMSNLLDKQIELIHGNEVELNINYILDGNMENLIEVTFTELLDNSIAEKLVEKFDWILDIKDMSEKKFVFVFERCVLPPYDN